MDWKYKIFILGLQCLLLVQNSSCIPEELQELADMLHRDCQSETGVPEEMIQNCRHGVFADDDRLKCYIKCLMAQMAIIDEDDGTIDEEGALAILPDEFKEKGGPVIKKCGTKRGSSVCETAFLTHKCYQSEAPDDYFLP